jgi:hypothetical protein
MLRGRPGEAVKGARGLPKARMLERIALTDWLLQPATFAIWSAVKRPAWSIAWICSRCATAILGAMMVVTELLAGGHGRGRENGSKEERVNARRNLGGFAGAAAAMTAHLMPS